MCSPIYSLCVFWGFSFFSLSLSCTSFAIDPQLSNSFCIRSASKEKKVGRLVQPIRRIGLHQFFLFTCRIKKNNKGKQRYIVGIHVASYLSLLHCNWLWNIPIDWRARAKMSFEFFPFFCFFFSWWIIGVFDFRSLLDVWGDGRERQSQ